MYFLLKFASYTLFACEFVNTFGNKIFFPFREETLVSS